MSPFELAIVLVSAFIHALWSVSIESSRAPLAFNLLQGAPLALAFIPIALAVPLADIPRSFWALLAVTGVAHGLYFYWLSMAYEKGDLSLVYPIARSTPAVLPLLAVPLLGERISLAGGAGIAIVVLGVWGVHLGGSTQKVTASRTRAWHWSDSGMVYAYLTLGTTVAYGLADKKLMLVLAATPWHSPVPRSIFCLFAMWLACMLVFVPLSLRTLPRGTLAEVARDEWPRAMWASLISIAGYGLILKALETAPSSYVVAARQSSVLFVVLMSTLFLGERPGWLRVFGAIVTVAGVVLIASAK